MKKSNRMLLGAMCFTSMMSHASEIQYDLGIGFESSSIVAKVSGAPEHKHAGMCYMAPRMDLSVSTSINGPIAAFARVSGSAGSHQSGLTTAADMVHGRELQAMAGFSYDLGSAVYAVAPVISFADYKFLVGEDSEALRNLSAVGLSGSIDVQHEKVGVRFYTEYLINSRYGSWKDDSLSDKIGNLGANVTKVGVSVFGDKQLFA